MSKSVYYSGVAGDISGVKGLKKCVQRLALATSFIAILSSHQSISLVTLVILQTVCRVVSAGF